MPHDAGNDERRPDGGGIPVGKTPASVTRPDPSAQGDGPYGRAALVYWEAGWHGLLPVPFGSKKPVPPGWTGHAGDWPSRADVQDWIDSRGGGNIALRLPPVVLGIDVDDYDDKHGGDTLAGLEAKHGPLPATWKSTSRDDGISGIRVYRIPEGLRWPSILGPGIEVVRWDHRYCMVWPSGHPKSGVYRWIRPDGSVAPDGVVPRLDDLPELPEVWVGGLTHDELAAAPGESSHLSDAATSAWLVARGTTPCPVMAHCLARGLVALTPGSSRHDWALGLVLQLVSLAGEGHRGAHSALDDVLDAFRTAVGSDRTADDLNNEMARMVTGAVGLAAASSPDVPDALLDPCTRPTSELGLLQALKVANAALPIVSGGKEPAPGAEPDAGDLTGVRHVTLTPASEIQPRPVFWLWAARLALGTLALLAGREGVGKSTLAYWLAARVTRGELPGRFYGTSKAVLVCATEDSWEHTIVPRLMVAGADLTRVYRVEVTTALDITVGLTMPRDLVAVERAAREHDAALLLLDPLISRLGDLNTHIDSEVRQALEPLTALADRAKMSVVGIIHHNKSGTTDPLQAVMGSKAFSAVARSVHTVIADTDDESGARRLFGTPKNNLGRGDLPTLSFTIEGAHVETDEGTAWTGRLAWGEDIAGTIDEAMRRGVGGGEDRSAIKEATAALRDYLDANGGEARSADVKKALHADGHSEASIRRAREHLNLTTSRTKGFQPSTWWKLPVVSPQSGHLPRGEYLTDTTDTTGHIDRQSCQSRQSCVDPARDDTTGEPDPAATCTVCLGALDPALVAEGETTHASCQR